MPVEDLPVKARRPGKKKKPVVVEYRWKPDEHPIAEFWRDWMKMGRYRTKEEAETVIKNDRRKHYDRYEYRIVM